MATIPADVAHSRPPTRSPKTRKQPAVVVPTEAADRRAVVAWAAVMALRHPALHYLVGIHNELPFVRATVKNRFMFFRYLRAMGHKAGLPDLLLPVARHGYLSAWFELKREKSGRLSPEQIWWHHALRAEGHYVTTTRGAAAAEEAILWYVQGPRILPVSRETRQTEEDEG